MSDHFLPDDDILICPNCKAVNRTNTIVCVGCGIRLDTYHELNQQWQERQNEKEIDRIKQNQSVLDTTIQKENVQSRKTFIKQFVVLIFVTIILAGISWGVAFFIDYRNQIIEQQLEALYQNGETCFDNHDYLCARDTFLQIYKKEPDYKDIKNLLVNSKFHLAEEYIEIGQINQALIEMEQAVQLLPGDPSVLQKLFEIRCQMAEKYAKTGLWQNAIDELEKALEIYPGSLSATNQMKNTYDRWYQDALDHNKKFKAWQIQKMRDARFPK